jgi:hypothetical protein
MAHLDVKKVGRIRPWVFRWDATVAEASRPMDGDDLCPRPHLNATRAVTVDAAPEDIWPWLVQWGWNRAGFYGYDLMDNLGRPSSQRVLPQFQHLAVGGLGTHGRQANPVHRLSGHPARTECRYDAFALT